MTQQISEFIQKYYIDPIKYGTGYNIYNTFTYAIIFIIASFCIYKLLKYLEIKIDNKFIFGILPYVVLGSLLRSLEDAKILSGFLYKTPLIYFLIFIFALTALVFSILFEKLEKIGYHNIWFVIGLVIDIFCLIFIRFSNAFAFFAIISITVLWVILFFVLKKITIKKYKNINRFLSKENLLLLNIHMFDASTTFTALQFFSYFEQHVLPSFLINILGPWIMFPLKLIVVSLVLYFLDKEIKENDKKNFIKLLVLILGLAPGLRNFFRMIMSV